MAEEYAPGSFVLSNDTLTGTMQKMHVTPDQRLVFETTCDLGRLPDYNAEQRNAVSNNEKLGDMVKVASLPMMVYLDLVQRGILNDRTEMRKWLASDEAFAYRTHRIKS